MKPCCSSIASWVLLLQLVVGSVNAGSDASSFVPSRATTIVQTKEDNDRQNKRQQKSHTERRATTHHLSRTLARTRAGGQVSKSSSSSSTFRRLLPNLDEVDKSIVATLLPLSLVFAIFPLTQALDLFWVNRLGDTLAVAGQAAANQVYNSAFWLFAFLPSVTATLVSKSHAAGDLGKTQENVCQALLMACLLYTSPSPRD